MSKGPIADREPEPHGPWIEGKLPLLLPYREAATYFGVTPTSFLNWVHSGRVRVIRTSQRGGGRLLVEWTEVLRLLDTMRKESQVETERSDP
jgi:predicted site-specific integrase-resolvase